MAENRNSDNVVLPDISEAEQLTAEHDEDRENGDIKTIERGESSNSVVTVPVSLPVGTLIAGTTFNVITSEGLPHFKPMLCVDNGFITGSPVSEELKATHIVIQNPRGSPRPRESRETTAQRENTTTWEETANMPVLPVRCKNTSAELHKHRFGSGGRGRCIKLGLRWYTPSEFEAACGRASSKDWKRSIRFGGRSIQALIDEGILTPHATSCTCGACCDDQTAMGPVRLFTPYKRRRKNQSSDSEEKKPKVKRSSLCESEIETSNSHSKEAWQTIAEGLDTNADYHLLDNTDAVSHTTAVLPDASNVLTRLDEIGGQLTKLVTEFKSCVEEVKHVNSRQLERLEQERAAALLAASVEAQVDVGDQAPLHSTEDSDSKKCANCNREASAECSLCRRTPYCSTFCQKKDWASHQIECLRVVPAIHTENQQHQSIMLIVESQHQ